MFYQKPNASSALHGNITQETARYMQAYWKQHPPSLINIEGSGVQCNLIKGFNCKLLDVESHKIK